MRCIRQVSKKRVQAAILVIGLLLVMLIPVSFGGDDTQTQGFVRVDYRDNALSVDATKATLSTIFEDMARATGYEFIVPEKILHREATLGCARVSIEEGIKKVLAAAGIDSHALVFDYRTGADGKGVVRQIKVFPMASSPREVKGAVISARGVTGPGIPEPGGPSEVPEPGAVATEVPAGGPVSTELPQPGPVSKDLPMPESSP